MSNIEQYYTKLSQDIITYIKEEQYQKALDLIDAELEQPYIPNVHYVNLLNTREEIIQKMSELNYNQEINNLTKLQIWDKIYQDKRREINIVYLNLFFQKFENEIDDVDYSMMQKIFNNQKLSNEQKTILVSTLVENNIDHEFAYYNNFTQQTTNFNPTKINNQQLDELFAALETIFLKDPSQLQIASSLLQVLSIEFFPNTISFESQLIVDTIKNVVNFLFNQTEIVDNEISEILKRHIGYYDQE